METYRGEEVPHWSLTKLYADAKKSYTNTSPTADVEFSPELITLHREFNIQKDRLLAWGLEWSDDSSPDGSIDAAVNGAGLADVVSSVMENIKRVLDDLETMRQRAITRQARFPSEKDRNLPRPARLNQDEVAQFAQMVGELTTAVDLLCELSKSRPGAGSQRSTDVKDKSLLASEGSFQPFDMPGERGQPARPLKFDMSSLILPDEGPPPYDSFGVPCPARLVGYLRPRPSGSQSSKAKLAEPVPVFIEYAAYDGIYQHTGVPLPMSRLDRVYDVLAQSPTRQGASLLRLLGYFEDPSQPRFGLVYELPSTIYSSQPMITPMGSKSFSQPTSLLNLLQSASKLHQNPMASASLLSPSLEARYKLAYELATSFSFVNQYGLTHGEVNSSSIIFFSTVMVPSSFSAKEPQVNVREPVICSFDVFSEFDIETSREVLHQNIYRHPEDPRMKGPTSAKEYRTEFDLYSLGLVLLEVGLWAPLADVFKEKYSLQDFRTRVERIWTKRLASKAGSLYMRAVQDCLGVSNGETRNDDSVRATYERVLGRLQKCCLLDDDDGFGDPMDQQSIYAGTESLVSEPQSYSVKRTMSQPNREGSLASTPAPPSTGNLTKIKSSTRSEHSQIEKPKRYRFPDRKLPPEVLEQWPMLGKRLANLVCKALEDPKETMSVDLVYTGESEATSKPTFEVECCSTKKVRQLLRRKFQYDASKFDLVVTKGRIVRSKSSRAGSARRSGANVSAVVGLCAMNPFHHARPLCGASIGAWKDNEHLPPVSFGGVVMVDGEPYGMSVHHLLEDPDDMQEEQAPPKGQPARSMATNAPDEYFAGIGSSLSFDPAVQSSPFEVYEDSEIDETSDDESDFGPDLDSFSDAGSDGNQSDVEDDFVVGDTEGIALGDGDEIIITQPALNDVADGFFPSEEDRDEDHIDSHTLGYVHASSGFRRLAIDGVDHEVDWALLKLNKDRLQPFNLVAGGKRYCRAASPVSSPQLLEPICRQQYNEEEDFFPGAIAPADKLGSLAVHCFGRTSGLASGTVSQTMAFVKFPGRKDFSESWTVRGNFGVGGDSGAWVIDNEHGRICGHVLAWSASLKRAYIAPMEMLFEDIRRTLGAEKIGLPGAAAPFPLRPHHIDISNLTLETTKSSLRAQHMLITGSPTHMEREWSSRREALGQVTSTYAS